MIETPTLPRPPMHDMTLPDWHDMRKTAEWRLAALCTDWLVENDLMGFGVMEWHVAKNGKTVDLITQATVRGGHGGICVSESCAATDEAGDHRAERHAIRHSLSFPLEAK